MTSFLLRFVNHCVIVALWHHDVKTHQQYSTVNYAGGSVLALIMLIVDTER